MDKQQERGWPFDMPPVAPAQIFDDVFYIGKKIVGIFVVKTSEGLVLIDALDIVDADEKCIIPGLRELGLDPKDINTIILTHGHFDHFAGAKRLQDRYHCKVALGLVDSGFMVYSENPMEYVEHPHIDLILEDGKELRFGDHRFIPCLNPGHTPGGMSLIFNVHDGGEEHWVSLWVGAGLPRAKTKPQVAVQMEATCQYINSLYQFEQSCEEKNCDVVLGVHPHRCDLFPKLEQLSQRQPGQAHPFVVGPEGVKANLQALAHGALEQAGQIIDEM